MYLSVGERLSWLIARERFSDREVPILAVRNHRLTWLEVDVYAIDLHRDDIRLEDTKPEMRPTSVYA